MATRRDAAYEALNRHLYADFMRESQRQHIHAPVQDFLGGLGTTTTGTTSSPREAQLARQLKDAQHRQQQLLLENAALRTANQRLRAQPPAASLTDATLKELIVLCHPDKWPDNQLAHEITVRLNQLRATLKG